MRLTFDTPSACTADLAEDARTIGGTVIPYGVPGATSLGKLVADRGAITLPGDLSRIKLTREHDRAYPRGYAVAAADGEDGLSMLFRAARTPAGDEALLEAAEKVRDGLSVDLDDVEIRAGHITSARLVAVGQVAVPAYEAARVAASGQEKPPAETEPAETEPEDEPEEDEVSEDETTVQASVPVGIPRQTGTEPAGIHEFYRALTAAHKGSGREVRAALQNITRTANEWVQPTQYEGELWQGVAYQRQIVPLISSADLTGWKVAGWRWVNKPAVAPYAGDKTAVPSNAVSTEPVEIEAERLAGAHDIDRKFRDFNDAGFFASYYAAMAESYARLSDEAALTELLGAAGSHTAVAGVDAWVTILTMALAVQDATGASSTFAIVGANVYLDYYSTTNQNAPARDNPAVPTITYHSSMDPDGILVGTRAGATFYELPGSPIRAEAIDMVNGGVDAGVFGYYAMNVHASDAFLKTDTTPLP